MRTPFAFFTDGIAAVALFFVLSGFVLTYKNFAQPEKYSLRNSLDVFLIHRIMRIMPPFMAWVLMSAIAQRYLGPFVENLPHQSVWLRAMWAEPVTLHRILRELVIVAPAPGVHLVPQDWSLTYELNISLFVPLYTLLGIVGNFPFYFYLLLRSTNNVFLFQFFLGMAMAKHFNLVQRSISRLNKTLCLIFFFLGLSLYYSRFIVGPMIPPKYSHSSEIFVWVLNGLGAAIIIAIAIGSEKFQKILLHKSLIWLGKVSYSLYLLHIVVIMCVTPHLVNGLEKHISEGSARWLSLVITAIICLVLSQFSYTFIEEPSIKFGRKLSEKWKSFVPWTSQ